MTSAVRTPVEVATATMTAIADAYRTHSFSFSFIDTTNESAFSGQGAGQDSWLPGDQSIRNCAGHRRCGVNTPSHMTWRR